MNQGAKSIMIGVLGALAGAGAVMVASGAASQAPVAPTDKAAIEKIVREYILTHPEILPEAMQNLERKEAAKRVAEQGDKVERPFAGAWEGSSSPDVTLVEFFDYACGYCRASRPDVERLLREDKNIRVVYRELPILGPASTEATRVSLAVAKLGGYGAFHKTMFGAGRPSPEAINAAIAASGIDAGTVRDVAKSAEVTREIEANLGYQQSLSLSGTPSWIIGDQLIGGAVGYDELKAAIAEARAAASGKK
jgi:protein-disulfide isomerase